MDSIEIPVGDMTFDAIAAGPDDGRLVLLLHGFPQTSHSWRRQLEALAEAGYRAVAPDQRGYSPRARPDAIAEYAVEHLVNDVLAMADELGGHRFDLVGHDWGAAVAWAVADRHPDRLRTLTALSVPHPLAFAAALGGDADQQQRSGYIELFRQEGGAAEEALLGSDAAMLRALFAGMDGGDEYVRHMQQPGALTAALNWYRAMEPGLVGQIGPTTVPTMYVWSTDDMALGRTGAEATAQHVTGPYRFEVLEGVSHWIADEAPDDLNRLLLDFLAAH